MKTYYYPGKYNPLHEVRDWAKVRSMIRALRRGEQLPPVYTDGGSWLSGTHRVSASEIRAELDGLAPYNDLTIYDMSNWLDKLNDDEKECIWTIESEDLCSLFDTADTFDEFRALLHETYAYYLGPVEEDEEEEEDEEDAVYDDSW